MFTSSPWVLLLFTEFLAASVLWGPPSWLFRPLPQEGEARPIVPSAGLSECLRTLFSSCLPCAHSCWATRLPAGASFPRRDRRHASPCRVFTVFLLCQLSMFHAPSCSYFKAVSTSPCARAATRPRFLGAAAGEAPSLRAAQRPSARPAVRQPVSAACFTARRHSVSRPFASGGPTGEIFMVRPPSLASDAMRRGRGPVARPRIVRLLRR